MAKSRLNEGAAAGSSHHSVEEMRAYCFERNCKAQELGWPRWNYIRETRDGWEMEHVVGVAAEEVWLMLDDKPLVPVGWPQAEIAKDHGLARWRLQRGTPADVFMLWAAPHREERRKAWVASQHGGRAESPEHQSMSLGL